MRAGLSQLLQAIAPGGPDAAAAGFYSITANALTLASQTLAMTSGANLALSGSITITGAGLLLQSGSTTFSGLTLNSTGAQKTFEVASGAVALIFPDFKSFDVVDAVILGDTVPFTADLQMTGLAAVYLTLYMLAAWVLFADKEL